MTCYICAEPAVEGIKVHDSVVFSYCDKHRGDVAIGISEYALKGTVDKLEQMKEEYMVKFKGAAYNEFIKCQGILDNWKDGDSSVTEQAI